jgi:hypothetical protein
MSTEYLQLLNDTWPQGPHCAAVNAFRMAPASVVTRHHDSAKTLVSTSLGYSRFVYAKGTGPKVDSFLRTSTNTV